MDAKTMRRSICDDKPVLRLPCDRVTANRFNIAHFWFQGSAYHKAPIKSIHKKQQNFLRISTGNTPLSALAQFIGFYVNHIYSSYLFGNGTFRLKSDERCRCGGKSCFQRFGDEPSFPATHGLKAHDFFIVKRDATSFDTWRLTHAALVSQNKTAHELHEFSRKKISHTRRDKHQHSRTKNRRFLTAIFFTLYINGCIGTGTAPKSPPLYHAAIPGDH